MQLYPIKSKLVRPGDSLIEKIIEALVLNNLRVQDGDVLAVASKVVSLSENNIISLRKVKPSLLAKKLALRHGMSPEFTQVVLDEAETVYGGVTGALLTLKHGNATANSGVDRKNSPGNTVVPWPANSQRSANKIRKALNRKLRKKIGLIIVDSRVTPLRLGTIGLAIACSGFQPVADVRGSMDLYGRKTLITFRALADGIAGAAHLLMGETRETTPFVLVRGAPIALTNDRLRPMTIPIEDCLYMGQISRPKPRS